MAHQIGGDLVEPVPVGDEMVLPAEASRDGVFFVLAQFGFVDDAGDLVAELIIGQMQFGNRLS